MQHLTWRAVFQIFGGIGVVWAALFYFWYRDDPRDHRAVNAAELALIGQTAEKVQGNIDTPWGTFLRSRSSWLLWLQWFCYFYGFYFYLTWLPTYLQEGRGVTVNRSALLASMPLFTAGAGSLVSGALSTRFAKRSFDLRRVRRRTAITGFLTATLLFLLFTITRNPGWAIVVLSTASFAAELSGPISWVTCMDLGGRYVGALSGAMNTMGHLAGIVAPLVTGFIVQGTGNWHLAFAVSAAIYSLGILCWLGIDPVTPLDRSYAVN
jgi:sugar phosphate permease